MPALLLIFYGCNKPPAARSERLGCLQIGEGGRLCSGETAFLAGPRVGLGRNEGDHKSTGEVFAVVPGIGIPAKLGGALAAYRGKSASAHRDNHNPFNQLTFLDTVAALRECRKKQLVPEKELQETLRALLHSNYLNCDLLVEAVRAKAVAPRQLHDLVKEWLDLYDPKAHFNLYLTHGNEAWLSRLVKWNVFSREEARERLRRELAKHKRHDAGRLADAYRLKVEPREKLDDRLRREVKRALNRLPSHADPPGKLRTDKIKPIGRGGKMAFFAALFLGPRIGYGLNEGQAVTALEALCGVPILSTGPRLYFAVLGKKGHFFSQEAFENNILSPHHRERRALLRLAVKKGVLTAEERRTALRKMCRLDCPTLDLIEEARAAEALSAAEAKKLARLIGDNLAVYLPGRYEARLFERLEKLGGLAKGEARRSFEAWLEKQDFDLCPLAGLRDAVRAKILDERGYALILQERYCRIRYFELLDQEYNGRGKVSALVEARRRWRQRALLADGLPVKSSSPALAKKPARKNKPAARPPKEKSTAKEAPPTPVKDAARPQKIKAEPMERAVGASFVSPPY